VALVFLVPWIIGNVLICGYLLYPFNGIDLFKVDWKVPGYYFDFDKIVLSSWGKVGGQDIYVTQKMRFWEWMPIWLSRLDMLNMALVAGFVASTPVLLFFMPKNKKAIWPILFVLVSFLLIFLNGPHPRFLFGYMVSSLAFVFYFIGDRIPFKMPSFALPVLGALLSGFLLFKLFADGSLQQGLLKPKPYPNEILEERSLGNFKFHVSKQTNLCWDKFPSTYYFIDSVELRGKSVEEGFRVGQPSQK
jgi:hypothetical protein